MKRLIGTLMCVGFVIHMTSAQYHVSPCGDNQHGAGICYGYAMGRVGGKNPGDATCNPLTFHPNLLVENEEGELEVISTIDETYFTKHETESLSGLSSGDIVYFQGMNHVSYVSGIVQSPVGNTLVDDYSPSQGHRQDKTLQSTAQLYNSDWKGYFHKKTITATVKNDYDAGTIKKNGVEVTGGSQTIEWWKTPYNTFEAYNHRFHNGVRKHFTGWNYPGGSTPNLTVNDIPRAGETYVATFSNEYFLEVPSDWSLDDAIASAISGETISVSGPQTVTGSKTISAGVTLKLNAGSSVSFASASSRLLIQGHLEIAGTAQSHAILDGNNFTRTSVAYPMVVINNGGSASITYADFKKTNYQLFFINNSGSSTVSNCTFATFGYGASPNPIYISNSSGTITVSNSTITGSGGTGTGIYVLTQGSNVTIASNSITGCNTAVRVSSASPDLTGNSIYGNSSYGIDMYNVSSSYVEGNQIQTSGYGPNITSSSMPHFLENMIFNNTRNVFISGSTVDFGDGDAPGNNVIANAGSPLLQAQNYSSVYMGYTPSSGRNSVYETDLPHLWITNNSLCFAKYDYWGEEGPTYYKDGSSTVFVDNPLWTDPNDPYPSRVVGSAMAISPQKLTRVTDWYHTSMGESVRLSEAMEEARLNNLLSAQEILKGAISERQPTEAPIALSMYFDMAHGLFSGGSTTSDLVQVNKECDALLSKLRNGAQADLLRPYAMTLLARRYALGGDVATAEGMYSQISSDYPGTFHETTALHNLFMYALETLGDIDEASRLVNRMMSSFPEEELTKLALSVWVEATGLTPEWPSVELASGSPELVAEFVLEPAVPNPFNPTTAILFRISIDSYVRLSVFDLLGREVDRLVDGDRPAGSYQVGFEANNLPSGVYIYRLDAGRFSATRKMVLAR